MTAQTETTKFRTNYRAPSAALSFAGVLKSEFIKITSIRSITVSVCVAAFLVIAVGFGGTAAVVGIGDTAWGGLVVGQFATIGALFAQLVFAIVGVIAVTGEYSTGQIRSSLTAVPKRIPVLVAKSIVLAVIAFVVSALSIMITALLITAFVPIIGGLDRSDVIIDSTIATSTFGASAFIAILTVFSVAVGTLVRNGAGGIAIVLGLMLVVPTVFALIPVEALQNLLEYQLPSASNYMLMPGTELTGDFWKNFGIAVAWPTVALTGAAVLLHRRDA